MRDTTGHVTSRTVGYKRISSIFPMQPNKFCIWSLVACGAMFVTWTTLVDMIKNRWIFSLTHSLAHSHSGYSFRWKPQNPNFSKHSKCTRRKRTMNETHQTDRHTVRNRSIHNSDDKLIGFSRFITRFRCFRYVYHTRQCTPFLKQEKEVSVTANTSNRIIWHATTLIFRVARCRRIDSSQQSLYTSATKRELRT